MCGGPATPFLAGAGQGNVDRDTADVTKTKRRLRKRTPWQRLQRNMRRRVVSGLLVVVPLGITVFVIDIVYDATAGILARVIQPLLGPLPPYLVAAISVAVVLALLYLIGLVTTIVLGRRLIALGEAIIQRIPFVKTVYGGSKQIVEAFSMQGGLSALQSAVFVEFPRPGMRAIGFVTGRIATSGGHEYLKIFIPTTPNFTTGFFELVPPDQVMYSELSAEDASKMLMSGGLLAPERLEWTPATEMLRNGRGDGDGEEEEEEDQEG